MSPYPKGDVRYVRTPDESLAGYKAATLEDVKKFYSGFLRRLEGELALVGDFDAKETHALADDALRRLEEPAGRSRAFRVPTRTWLPSTRRSRRLTRRMPSSSPA